MANKDTKKTNRHFFKDFKAELKKVIWPTPKQVVNNTVAVIVIVVITAALVFVLDLAFDLLNTYGVDKLKFAIDNKQENVVISNNEVQSDVNAVVDNTTNSVE
jgi:preprotein translocase SecE subunit